ncbi:DUF3040 domain-containing protein [Arthrobacter sp. ISL-28]|uniref:DUF3040 domain-containing protein n=1 Tax=Arthrobacter sp. ISL-28 TaxID=2819108 RepID=UPI001BE551E2|nr:DUF3040 domain-containing protein [Arthrobacter sp. ISL-28]MBT2522602.1 DUF3040 domain-containing protein [Arthrobacter sp. ISL-28]
MPCRGSGLTALAGVLLIIVGIMTQLIILGVFGFIIMGAAAYWFLSKRLPRGRAR